MELAEVVLFFCGFGLIMCFIGTVLLAFAIWLAIPMVKLVLKGVIEYVRSC